MSQPGRNMIDTRPDSPLLKDLWALVIEYLDLASRYASRTLFGCLSQTKWDADAVFGESIATKNVDLFRRLLGIGRVRQACELTHPINRAREYICMYDQVTMMDAFGIYCGQTRLTNNGRNAVIMMYELSALHYGSVRVLRCLRDEYGYSVDNESFLLVIRHNHVAVFRMWLEKSQELRDSIDIRLLSANFTMRLRSPEMLECLLAGFPDNVSEIARTVFFYGTVPVAERFFQKMGHIVTNAHRLHYLELALQRDDDDPAMAEYLVGKQLGDVPEGVIARVGAGRIGDWVQQTLAPELP